MTLFPADPRTKNIAHYVISHTRPPELGATKLNKVLWRADIIHYRRYGKTITGQSSYIRMPQGPVPNFINQVLDELKAEGSIVERPVDTRAGVRREFVWLKKPSASVFTSSEIEAIHEAISIVCAGSATEASNNTHDALWLEFADGQQMPIRAAAITVGNLDPEDIQWALEASAT
ncbi:MAG: DUF4065 domain-containing protein [Alphaproteobacteria bacterium]|nr:DUF4065 domain-containing protein [Alphaproteobacteria bacterium]